LDSATKHPITVVSGGPGTGKTLAVASWVRDGDGSRPVAWVSIDPLLSTPRRFWSAVSVALVSALDPPTNGSPRRVDLGREDVVAEVAALLDGREVVLVLDDVHELDGEVLADLDHVLRMPPTGLRVVLVSRYDPPLALNRHRVAGRLAELRAADLAFTAGEVRILLRASSLAVPDDVVATLVETSDGWPALLRLAVIMMQAADDPIVAGRHFSGDQPMVASYLAEEVLGNLSPQRQDFLLRTGVPGRICAPLATALTGDPSAGEVLAELFHGDQMMVELDGSGWYRYHPLLQQTLQARLRLEQPDLEPELHQHASTWLEGHGEWLSALEHAIESGNHSLAVQAVLRSGAVGMFTEDWAVLPVLIDRISRTSAPQDPELQVALAVQSLIWGQDNAAWEFLTGAEEGVRRLPEPRRSVALLCLRVMMTIGAGRAGDVQAAVGAARDAEELARSVTADQAPGWAAFRDVPSVMRGIAEMWAGHPRTALSILQSVHAEDAYPPPPGIPGIYVTGYVALALALAGEFEPARDRALAALRQTEGAGRPRLHEATAAWCALAIARAHQGDADGARAAIAAGERVAAQAWHDACVATCLRLAAVQLALLTGNVREARRLLTEVDGDLRRHPQMTYAVRLRPILGVECALVAGTPSVARDLLSAFDAERARVDGAPEAPDPTVASRARVLLATGRAEAALEVVAREVASTGEAPAAAWLAAAVAHHKLRHDALAAEALAHAVDAAAPHREVLPFRHAGPELSVLLRRHEQLVGSHPDFVRALLTALPRDDAGDMTASPAPLVEPLTERELAVLAFLPTMSSNAEIAAELGISVNTVKRHLKAVHRKLGVSTRRDAARAARRLDLLPG